MSTALEHVLRDGGGIGPGVLALAGSWAAEVEPGERLMPRGPCDTCAQVWLFPISVEGVRCWEFLPAQSFCQAKSRLSGNACDFLVGSLILW